MNLRLIFQGQGDDAPLVRLAKALTHRWHHYCLVAGGAVATASALTSGTLLFWMAMAAIVLVGAGTIGDAKQKPSYADLKDELDKSNDEVHQTADVLRELLKLLMADIGSRALSFGADERMSIYRHDQGAFVLLARYSSNPTLEVPGRGVYDDSQGVIALAWRSGTHYVTDLPQAESEYLSVHRDSYNFTDEITKKLTMRPRSVVGIRYPEGPNNPPIGVVVIESHAPRKLNSGTAQAVKLALSWDTLTAFLTTQRHNLPSMSDAAGRGF